MKYTVLLAVCLVSLLIPASAAAQEAPARISIGAKVGYVDIASFGKQVNIAFAGVPYYEGFFELQVSKYASCELSFGYLDLDVDGTMDGVTLDFGELQQFPVILTIRYHLPFHSGRISPYLGGGVGYYFNSFDTSRVVSLAGGEIDTDDSAAFHLGAGIKYHVADDVALCLDVKHVWNEADGTLGTVGAAVNDDLDLNTTLLGLALVFSLPTTP